MLLPALPSAANFEEALRETVEELKQVVQGLRKVKEENDVKLGEAVSQARDLLTKTPAVLASTEECEAYVNLCTQIINGLENLPSAARRYRDALRIVEAAVGAAGKLCNGFLFL